MNEIEYREKYQAAIPACCEFQTFEEHAEILMLCWGLAHQIRTGGDATPCGICEHNTSPEGLVAREAWNEERRKQRVWDVISSP